MFLNLLLSFHFFSYLRLLLTICFSAFSLLVQIKGCVTVLKGFTDAETDGLMNALRFTTVHLNDAETPAAVKALLS